MNIWYKVRRIIFYGLTLFTLGMAPVASATENKVAPVADLLNNLKQKLTQNPNDMEGWVLLGKSYHFLGDYPAAKDAYSKAKALGYQGNSEIIIPKAGTKALPKVSINRNLLQQFNRHSWVDSVKDVVDKSHPAKQ